MVTWHFPGNSFLALVTWRFWGDTRDGDTWFGLCCLHSNPTSISTIHPFCIKRKKPKIVGLTSRDSVNLEILNG